MNCFKKLFFVCIAIFLVNNFVQVKSYPHLALKNLFNVLKIDDIGFGHVLLHSNWIENIYQYGAGKAPSTAQKRKQAESGYDGVANLVRTLWFRFDESFSLQPAQKPDQVFNIDSFDPKIFGKLINLTYNLISKGEIEKKIINIDQYSKIKVELRKSKYNLKKMHGKLKKIKKDIDNVYLDVELLEASEEKQDLKDARAEYRKALKEFWDNKKKIKALRKRFDRGKKEEFDRILKEENLYHFRLIEAFAKYIEELSVYCIDDKELDRQIEDIVKRIKRRGILDRALSQVEKPKVDIKGLKKELKNKKQYIAEEEKKFTLDFPELKFLVRRVKRALETCKQGLYVSRIVPGILWAFFFHKIDKLRSIEARLNALYTCLNNVSPEYKNQVALDSFYDKNDFETFEEKIKDKSADEQMAEIFDNYDLALDYLLSKLGGGLPAKVSMGSGMRYEYKMGEFSNFGVPDCFETAFHDLFSVLWYNRDKKTFDNSLFSEDIIKNGKGFKRFREALKYFYLAGKDENIDIKDFSIGGFTSLEKLKSLGKITQEDVDALELSDIPVDFIKRPEIKQEFLNIVSNIPGIEYKSNFTVKGQEKRFEVYPTINNFIKVLNYFYGTQAKTLEDLDKEDIGISLKGIREVTFKSEKVEDKDHIEVSVNDATNDSYFNMIVEITPKSHATLIVPSRDQAGLNILKSEIAKKLLAGGLKDPRRTVVFTLLISDNLLSLNNLSLPILNLIYYSLDMQSAEVKLEIIENILEKYPNYFKNLKVMIENLIEKFPLDDHLVAKLNRIIIVSGFLEKEPLQGFIRKRAKDELLEDFISSLDDEQQVLQFYGNLIKEIKDVNEKQLIVPAIGKGFKIIAELIRKRPEFDINKNPKLFDGFILKKALENGLLEVALLILQNTEFKTTEYIWFEIYKLALKDPELLLAVAKHPTFSIADRRWEELFKLALEDKEYKKDLLNSIVRHKDFVVRYRRIKEVLKLLLKEGLQDLALTWIKRKSFNFSSRDSRNILEFVLKNGYKAIALAIVSKPEFNAGDYYDWKILFDLASQKKFDKVVLGIISNPNFKVKDISDVFRWAIKKGYKDVALDLINNPKFTLKYTKRVLQLAIEKGYRDIALAIVNNKKFSVGFGFGDLFTLALKKKWYDVSSKILEKGSKEIVPEILKKGDIEVVKSIIEDPNFDVNVTWDEFTDWSSIDDGDDTYTPLIYVLENKQQEIANFILDKRLEEIDFDIKGGWRKLNALILAAYLGYEDIVRKILKKEGIGVNVSKRRYNALAYALAGGYVDIAKMLIQHPSAEKDIKDVNWKKVLEMAKKALEKKPERKDDMQEIMRFIENKIKQVEKLQSKK